MKPRDYIGSDADYAHDLIPEERTFPSAEIKAAIECLVARSRAGDFWMGPDDDSAARIARTTAALMENVTMSWSFSAVGKPDAVKRAIETQNSGLTGQSLAEWQEAQPALLALVGANVGNVAVRVNASGHASFASGDNPDGVSRGVVKTHGQCSVVIESLYGFVE